MCVRKRTELGTNFHESDKLVFDNLTVEFRRGLCIATGAILLIVGAVQWF